MRGGAYVSLGLHHFLISFRVGFSSFSQGISYLSEKESSYLPTSKSSRLKCLLRFEMKNCQQRFPQERSLVQQRRRAHALARSQDFAIPKI